MGTPLIGAKLLLPFTRIASLADQNTNTCFVEIISDAAARLRQQYRLKTPDAIIAATAAAQGVPLLTRDAALAAVPDAVLAYT
jgi:predicted nucleic acid-binding protein